MTARTLGVGATSLVALLAAFVGWLGLTGGAPVLATFAAPVPALDLVVGVTPLAGVFAALLALLAAACALWCARRERGVDAVLIAGFAAAMVLVLCARSVTVFFFAWEAAALVSVVLVLAHHERRAVQRAAVIYLLVSQTGAICILVMFALLEAHAGSATFEAMGRMAPTLAPNVRTVVLALALVGFGAKAGIVPLHFWLPRAHPVAPAPASALLSGAMLNVALFALATVALELAAPVPILWGLVLLALGTLGALAGVLYALVERDLKRLLAYSSVEHVGIVVAALGAALLARAQALPALGALVLAAALFHAITHGAFKSLLFLGAGAVLESEGTVDLERLGGAWAHLPWTGTTFLVGAAALAAIPPLSGFASEWLILRSLADELHAFTGALRFAPLGALAGLALAGGLGLACAVRAFGIVFLGRARRPREGTPRRERFDVAVGAQLLLAAVCVVLGLLPALAFAPLARIAGGLVGAVAVPVPTLARLPLLFAVPMLGAVAALVLATRRGVRRVPTWTCGSTVTAASQYTATAFSKPLRRVFAFVLLPAHARVDQDGSRWFPLHVVYRTTTRYVIDEAARHTGAFAFALARRARVLQNGRLRMYVAYALAALIAVVAVAR